MNTCKLILFDMDGVTLDSEPLYAKGEIRLFEEYGVTIPKEDWTLFLGNVHLFLWCIQLSNFHMVRCRAGAKNGKALF